MPVKYQCTKCGRRYVEWGAEKLSFTCTCSEDAELVRAGSPEDKATRKPSLKRSVSRRPAAAARSVSFNDDADDDKDDVTEVDELEPDDAADADDDEEAEEEAEPDEPTVEADEEAAVEDDLETDDDDDDDDDDDEFGDDDAEVESVEDLNFDDIAKPIGSDKLHDAPDDEWSG